MKHDMQFGHGFCLSDTVNDTPMKKNARASEEAGQGLDDNFPWHRIRRMSRK